MKSVKVIFLIVLICFAVTSTISAEEETTDTLLAKIMLKLISFDKGIDRFGDSIKIGVTDDNLLIALRLLADTTIKGKPFVAEKIVLPKDVASCHVVFIGSSMKKDLEEIITLSTQKKILTFTNDKNCLKKGFAIALEFEDDLPVIWMNLANASKCGSEITLSSLTLVMIKGIIKE